MRDGECWELPLSGRITKGREYGLLPTVLASDWKGGVTAIRKDTGKQRLDQWKDYVRIKYLMKYPHPMHSEMRMGWMPGWTDLKPLATDKYHSAPLKHGES